MKHVCHAAGCVVPVSPKMFMCKHHWFMLPEDIRLEVWMEYIPGQEETKTPTEKYLEVARKAITWLKEKEYGADTKPE